MALRRVTCKLLQSRIQKRCLCSAGASSMFHWTVSLNFLAMCAADDKTDFGLVYTVDLILALSFMISLTFPHKCLGCPPSTLIINVTWFTS